MTSSLSNYDVGSFPMGPNLRNWFALTETSYRGMNNTTPSATDIASFTDIFMQSLEDKSPRNSDHFVDIIEELVGMNFPLLVIKFVDSYQSFFPHQDFRAQLHYGNAAMMVGDLARAESAFVVAQRLVPEEPAPYVNLTQIYCHDALFDKARQWCLAGLDVDSENTRLWELAAWLEQNESEQQAPREIVAQNIAQLAKQKNSWAGTSLACDLNNPDDVVTKADALAVFWNGGVKDLAFLIEYTAVLGMAGRYDKIPPIVWQSKRGDEKAPWQLLLHLAQAHLGLGRPADALDALNSANKSEDLPPDTRAMIESLMSEVTSELTESATRH
jgi:tetratricopeptide (TPR) repeat protein